MNKYKRYFLLLFVCFFCSCSDYLEIIPRDQISDASVWASTDQADLFLNDIYQQLPSVLNRFDPWENWSDDAMDGIDAASSRHIYALSAYDASNIDTQWGRYSHIRKCNLFIDRVTSSNLPDDWKKVRLAEAKFLRAYFYMLLWTWHGGVPIITDVLNQSEQGEAIFRERNTYEQTFQFITAECTEAAADLPLVAQEKGRITRGAALTLKAWCELIAASPLNNPTGDLDRWRTAASTFKSVMDLGVYKLFPNYDLLFLEENNYNEEVILSRAHIGGTTLGRSTEGLVGAAFTGGAQTGWGMLNPTQNIVDAYRMKNGLPISHPESGYDPQDPYKNREDRFYQSIVYDGSMWNGMVMYSRIGVGSFNELDLSSTSAATNTGYYLRKGLSDKYIQPGEHRLSSANSILFRYAEVLLGYAEAQNEASGPDQTVYDAVNLVRSRSNLPPLSSGLTKEEMRSEIYNERRVELAFEEKRWYDLIRLKIAETTLNGNLRAMKISEQNGKLVYEVIPAPGGARVFHAQKNYLLPLPQSAIDRNPKLTQNPNY